MTEAEQKKDAVEKKAIVNTAEVIANPHIDIEITRERMRILSVGRVCKLTQKGIRIRLIPRVACCKKLEKLLKTRAGKKAYLSFNNCPYCGDAVLRPELKKQMHTEETQGE